VGRAILPQGHDRAQPAQVFTKAGLCI